jgi:ribonuclease VapC
MIVLDASAVIALLLREPGHERVAEAMGSSAISAVNLAEVLTRMSRERVPPRTLATRLSARGLAVMEFDQSQAAIVADIRETARAAGLGLADCCCLALALENAWPVLSADRIWPTLGFDIEIELIR